MDLLMVRDRKTGRFIYTERLDRHARETPWKYVRREAKIRQYYTGEILEVMVGYGVGSVEELLESYPEYRVPAKESTSVGNEEGNKGNEGNEGNKGNKDEDLIDPVG